MRLSKRQMITSNGTATDSAARVNDQSRVNITATIPVSVTIAVRVGTTPWLKMVWTLYASQAIRYNESPTVVESWNVSDKRCTCSNMAQRSLKTIRRPMATNSCVLQILSAPVTNWIRTIETHKNARAPRTGSTARKVGLVSS